MERFKNAGAKVPPFQKVMASEGGQRCLGHFQNITVSDTAGLVPRPHVGCHPVSSISISGALLTEIQALGLYPLSSLRGLQSLCTDTRAKHPPPPHTHTPFPHDLSGPSLPARNVDNLSPDTPPGDRRSQSPAHPQTPWSQKRITLAHRNSYRLWSFDRFGFKSQLHGF